VAEVLETARGVTTGRAFCADVSHEQSEPLAATASRVDHWLLVEYRRLWSRDTIGGSGLSDELKEHLRAQLRALPNSRLLLVRRPERRGRRGLAVFLARSLEADRSLHGLEIDEYDELLGLDLAGALGGGTPVGAPVGHPLYVVCTHGKRDRCCAKHGRPLYDELREQGDEGWVWQSTHVGGDRFAGNVVTLPDGLFFGRMTRADVWPLLDEHLAGRIDLAHYRGRSCYGFAVQAAERRVREETGLTGVDDLRLATWERGNGETWTVRFQVPAVGQAHEVDVAAVLGDELTYLTCSAKTPQRPRRYVTTGHRVIPG
jgi:hypothetical protein